MIFLLFNNCITLSLSTYAKLLGKRIHYHLKNKKCYKSNIVSPFVCTVCLFQVALWRQ